MTESEYKYEVCFKFKTSDFFQAAKQTEDIVNKMMSSFGVSERVNFETNAPFIILTTNRLLTDEEKAEIIDFYNKQLVDKKIACTEIRFLGKAIL